MRGGGYQKQVTIEVAGCWVLDMFICGSSVADAIWMQRRHGPDARALLTGRRPKLTKLTARSLPVAAMTLVVTSTAPPPVNNHANHVKVSWPVTEPAPSMQAAKPPILVSKAMPRRVLRASICMGQLRRAGGGMDAYESACQPAMICRRSKVVPARRC
jgi:hypothetical protein